MFLQMWLFPWWMVCSIKVKHFILITIILVFHWLIISWLGKPTLLVQLEVNIKLNCGEVVRRKIKKNEVFARQSNTGVVILKWQDKREVLMLSTKHTDETKKVQVYAKDIEKPIMILDYNECKSLIDLFDQRKANSHCLRRGAKWYRKLTFELLFGQCIYHIQRNNKV